MSVMDRRTWLDERRAAVRAEYDLEAPGYDADDYPHATQASWVDRVVGTIPSGGTVLDIPCGTGRYFAQIAAAGRMVVGMDQSSGMLAQARAKRIAERLEQVGLQELAVEATFDAVLTIDAMENVGPEDWPIVLANLRRAAKPGGLLYMTVEELYDEAAKDAALATLTAAGAPAVRGEVVEGDVAGYHFYPDHDRILAWLAAAGLEVIEDVPEHVEGDWGYRHLVLRAPEAARP
jgi:cyclopropane fatty-acyl-phospholipid synthase-like methyltransferase